MNLAGALVVADGAGRLLAGRSDGARVVLVDDLLTTGASLAEAARAVRVAVRTASPAGDGTAVGLRAAVVAASPSAFEINRN
jgi:adenine/guanine phosphoribosyltransferase-like PRPP-binding protein